MECVNHPGVEPVARCVGCGKYVCASCAFDRGNRIYCRECAPGVPCEPEHILVSPEDLQVSRAFTFFLQDPHWPSKVVIGTLFMLASILVVPYFFVLGYQLAIVRSVAWGNDGLLPEWTGLGRMFKDGAALFLISLIYAVPMLLVVGGLSLLGVLVGGSQEPGVQTIIVAIALVGFVAGWLVVVAYGLVLRLATPAIIGTYASTASIRKALQPGVMVGIIRADIKAYLLVFLLTAFVTSTIAFLGVVACCIGVFVTSFYALLVNAHLIGQLARLNPLGGDHDAAS